MNRKLPWDIIISKLRGNLSEEGEISFAQWLGQDDNSHLFQQLQNLWDNIQHKVANYEPDLAYYWKELSAQINKPEELPQTNQIAPAISTRRFSLNQFFRIAVAASVLLAITFTGAYYLGRNNDSAQTAILTYSSLTGKSKVVLPDSTEVWLHSNTTLSYNSSFTSGTREVTLNGEAYFSVKHDEDKPFVVRSNDVAVTVHGTKFNVNSYESAQNILVSLFEGSVSMKTANKDVFLEPGQEGSFDKLQQTLEVKAGDVEFAKSWTNDQLRFDRKNLRYVCRYLEKWYAVDIDVDPAIADNQAYTFTLSDESLEEIVRIMGRITPIDYSFDADDQLIIKPKK